MVVICKKCFKKFQYPSQLKQHLNRKTPCNNKKKTKKIRKGKGNFKGKGNDKRKGKYQKKYNKDNKLVPHIFLKTDVFKHYKLKDNINVKYLEYQEYLEYLWNIYTNTVYFEL